MLRFLRLLVLTLTAVMLAGMVVLVVLFATRFPDPRPPLPVLPDTLELPPGATVQAVTQGSGWWVVVLTDAGQQEIRLFDATGRLRQRLPIAP